MHQEVNNPSEQLQTQVTVDSDGAKSMPFGGLPNDDPNEHIASFLEICDTQKHNGVPAKTVQLLLFPFSLKDPVNM